MASHDDATWAEDEVPSPESPDPDPFDPPADYRFEEELEGLPPRPLTPELYHGRHATRKRRDVSTVLLLAVLFTTCGMLPVVQNWGLYLVPLQYLTWIGIFCGVVGTVGFFVNLSRGGPYRYVKEGLPLVARIRALQLRPMLVQNAQPAAYRFFAMIQFRDPDSGALRVLETASNDISATPKDQFTTTYRVGDYATAVYLPGKLEKSLRLYGFLDLKPNLGVVRRDAVQEGNLLKVAGLIVAIFGLFGTLFWNVYAFEKFQPISMSAGQVAPPVVLGAIVLGGGMLAYMLQEERVKRARLARRNAEAAARGEAIEWEEPPQATTGWFGVHGVFVGLVIIAGSFLLGGLTMLCWFFTANALLDTSPPKFRPVAIERMVAVTHKAIFREYKIEYHFLDGDPKKRDYLSTPFEMAQFETDLARAEVHTGRFGWPWVKTLHPVALNVPAGKGAGP